MVMGLFGAAVYVGWESTARKASMQQLPVIDAIWGRRFLVKEIGDGLLKGYLLGGIIVGVFSFVLFLFKESVIQADSQFVFAEPSNNPKLVSINISAWSTIWIVSLSQVGVVYNLINNWFKKPWLTYLLSTMVTGITLTFAGRLVGTTAKMEIDLLIFVIVGVFAVYFYKEYGLLSVCTGLWIYSVIFLITPYMNSTAIDVVYVVWVQSFIIIAPFLFAFVAYRYGESVTEMEKFVPEYQSRQAEVMRVEKEIEIARESQYNLMPLQPPKGEGFDVHGFFLPSFEVGGDFYDYVLAENVNGEASSLTMTIVDVSGKAMRAAMPAVFTSGLLLSRMHVDNPSEILREVTRPLYNRTDSKTFVTCILAKLHIESKMLTMANAGHCYPILKRGGKSEFIETPEPRYPLGIKEEVNYNCIQTQLQEGDLLVLYSDGLPEASNEKGEWFSFERVKDMITEIDTDSLSSYEITQEIKRRIQKFSNYNLADDTTVICLKV
jgi:serine phosphatase RsbU (regulator of sigma subunit)